MKRLFTKIRELLHDPKFTTDFHKWTTLLWILLLVPTLLFWSQSILWLCLMSVWANIAGHWSAYQASRAELKQDKQGENSATEPGRQNLSSLQGSEGEVCQGGCGTTSRSRSSSNWQDLRDLAAQGSADRQRT